MPRLRHVPRSAWLALLVILLVGGGIRAYQAGNPVEQQSADAKSYTSIAQNLSRTGTYTGRTSRGPETKKAREKAMVQALHWPPATPSVFSLAYDIAPGAHPTGPEDLDVLYWTQFLISTLTILAAFALGCALTGAWTGVAAAAVVALYPPLAWGPSTLLSEPLGALLVTCAFTAATLAWRTGRRPWWALTGALFGGVLLTRTDLLFVPVLVALLALVVVGNTVGWKRGAQSAVLLVATCVVVVLPWTIYASNKAETLVPVTTGGGSALFVGTYLPGNGSTFDMKFAMRDQVIKRHPALADRPYTQIPAIVVLDDVVAKYRKDDPKLERDAALSIAARHNLRTYALGQPVAFAKMMAFKAGKMWSRYARGGATPTSPIWLGLHLAIVALAGFGLLWGVVRRRDPAIASILLGVVTATGVHTLAVAHGRYNLPLMPIVIVGGLAGWTLLLREWREARSRREASGEAPRPNGSVTTATPGL